MGRIGVLLSDNLMYSVFGFDFIPLLFHKHLEHIMCSQLHILTPSPTGKMRRIVSKYLAQEFS